LQGGNQVSKKFLITMTVCAIMLTFLVSVNAEDPTNTPTYTPTDCPDDQRYIDTYVYETHGQCRLYNRYTATPTPTKTPTSKSNYYDFSYSYESYNDVSWYDFWSPTPGLPTPTITPYYWDEYENQEYFFSEDDSLAKDCQCLHYGDLQNADWGPYFYKMNVENTDILIIRDAVYGTWGMLYPTEKPREIVDKNGAVTTKGTYEGCYFYGDYVVKWIDVNIALSDPMQAQVSSGKWAKYNPATESAYNNFPPNRVKFDTGTTGN